jgi:hypothetical protein
MARSTPAQKPRGLASRIVRGFLITVIRERLDTATRSLAGLRAIA